MEQRLSQAAMRGNVESLRQIIGEDGLILDKIVLGTFTGKNPLHLAASRGHTQIVEELLSHEPALAEVLDLQQRSALHLASAAGHANIVQALIKLQPALAEVLDSRQQSALHLASAAGHLNTVQSLIGLQPAHTEVLDSQQQPALHLSSAAGRLNIVQRPELCLITDGDGRNALHVAAMKGKDEVLEELVRANPHAARALVGCGDTILHLCVKYNRLSTLKMLLRKIGDEEFVNSKDSGGRTILHLAVYGEQSQIVEHILENSQIDKNATNANGHTAMDILFQTKSGKDSEKALLPDAKSSQNDLKNKTEPKSGKDSEKVLSPNAKGGQNDLESKIEDFLRKAKAKRAKDLVKGEWLTKKMEALMIVASLIATMAFQAGVNPPGGVWQDDSNEHRAGEAVMAYNYPDSYPYFLRSNTTGFVASLSTILLLISGLPFKKKKFMWILVAIMGLTITSMAFTYAFSIVVVTPKKNRQALSRTIVVAVIAWCSVMTFLLLVRIGRLIFHAFKERRSRNKAIERISIYSKAIESISSFGKTIEKVLILNRGSKLLGAHQVNNGQGRLSA